MPPSLLLSQYNKGTSGTLTNLKIGKSTSTTTNDFGGDLGELLIFTRQLIRHPKNRKVARLPRPQVGSYRELGMPITPYKKRGPSF